MAVDHFRTFFQTAVSRRHMPAASIAILGSIAWLAVVSMWARAEGLDPLTPGPVPNRERARLALDARYTQYVRAVEGIPVVASAKVRPQAVSEAAWLIDRMLAKRADVARAIARSPVRLVVMAHDEFTTDVPEHADLTPRDFWERRARGLGATIERPATSCGEENLLNFPGDPYATENILIHEFGHTIHEIGLRQCDPGFERRLAAAFESAGTNGRWRGTYARTNPAEYWAEGVQSWFSCNRTHDDEHGAVNSPAAVREHDPELAALLAEVFGDEPWCYVRPRDRDASDTRHIDGFDHERSPVFDWKHLGAKPAG